MHRMLKDTLKQFFTYGIGSITQTALSFFLLPLYLRFFEPTEYGVISVLLVVVSLLNMLANMGIISGLYRLYYEVEVIERKKLVGTTIVWYLTMAAFVSLVLLINAHWFSKLLFHTTEYTYSIRLVGIIFFFSLLQGIPFNILRLEKKSSLYVTFSLFNFFVDFFLKILFIVCLKREIGGYFESSILAYIITLSFMIPFILKYVGFSFRILYFKQLFKLGFPYVFSTFSVWTLEVSDRLILNMYSGQAAVGIYSLGYSFANLFNVFLYTPSALFWHPFFFSYAAEKPAEETKRLISKSLLIFFLPSCVLFLAVSLGSSDILRIFTSLFAAREGYGEAANLVPLLTLGPFLYLLSRQASSALLLAKKPEFTSLAACIGAVANVGLNFIFIPRFGPLGAAGTTVAAYLIYEFFCYWWAQKILPVNHEWKKLVRGFLFLSVAFFIGWLIKINHPWASLFIKIATSEIIFILLAWYGNILTRAEKNRLLTYVNSGKRRLIQKLYHMEAR